jgi:hypothetical protein
MNKFVLMQEPAKWVSNKWGYSTIGLKELYPNKGFSSCDEWGNTDYLGPFDTQQCHFAFLDEESEKAFKGKIKNLQVNPFSDTNNKIKFAVVKIKGS